MVRCVHGYVGQDAPWCQIARHHVHNHTAASESYGKGISAVKAYPVFVRVHHRPEPRLGYGIDSITYHIYYLKLRRIGGMAAAWLPGEFEATRPSFGFGNEGEGGLLLFLGHLRLVAGRSQVSLMLGL